MTLGRFSYDRYCRDHRSPRDPAHSTVDPLIFEGHLVLLSEYRYRQCAVRQLNASTFKQPPAQQTEFSYWKRHAILTRKTHKQAHILKSSSRPAVRLIDADPRQPSPMENSPNFFGPYVVMVQGCLARCILLDENTRQSVMKDRPFLFNVHAETRNL